MEDVSINSRNCDGEKKNTMNKSTKSLDESCLDFSSQKLGKENSDGALVLNLKRSQSCRRFLRGSWRQSFSASEGRIPKNMVSLDEKYLLHCMELIHLSALTADPSNILFNLQSSLMGSLSDDLNPLYVMKDNALDNCSFGSDNSVHESLSGVVSSPGQWIVGSIMESESMLNIMKSPLFRQLRALDGNSKGKKLTFDEVGYSPTTGFDSSAQLSIGEPRKVEKEMRYLRSVDCHNDAKHRRFVSMSSTNSMSSDQCSSSPSSSSTSSATPSYAVSQGMLQCTWKVGNPHFVFSLDDHRELYEADFKKVQSADSEVPYSLYSFYQKMQGQKDYALPSTAAHLVGRMKVLNRIIPDAAGAIETEFVLYGGCETFMREVQPSSNRKNRGLSKKVMEVFRNSQSSKQRSLSKYGEKFSTEIYPSNSCSCQDKCSSFLKLSGDEASKCFLPPNLELAAIVVKEHIEDDYKEEGGGWGLKFLKKGGVSQTQSAPKSFIPSKYSVQNAVHQSTCLDIIIPAGLHGGPRTRNGGPSSLTERWRSGGHCDCGGWDLGCPLTVLKTNPSNGNSLPVVDLWAKRKDLDLYVQGSEHCAPTLRMMNVRDDLYLVHFQSTLSALQSFAIAVACIHSWNHSIRSRNVQEMEVTRM